MSNEATYDLIDEEDGYNDGWEDGQDHMAAQLADEIGRLDASPYGYGEYMDFVVYRKDVLALLDKYRKLR